MKKYAFENFIVYEGNAMAHAAVLAAVNDREHALSPLFVHGGSGLGKTHLAAAAATRMISMDGNMSIGMTTGERFVGEMIYALCNRNYAEFMNRYKAYDVLIIDDLQNLTSTEAQSAFREILDDLLKREKQVILTSNVPPGYLADFDKQLLAEIGAGYIVELEAPCFEKRITIIKDEIESVIAEQGRDAVRGEVDQMCALIASAESSDIGRMEKLVDRIVTFASLLDETIDLEFAEKILCS